MSNLPPVPGARSLGALVCALFCVPVFGMILFAVIRRDGALRQTVFDETPPAASAEKASKLARPGRALYPLTRGEYVELVAAGLAGQLARGCAGRECARKALEYARDTAAELEASPEWPGRATMVSP